MIKRFVLAVVAVLIAWSVMDFIIHGLILQSTYQATAQLWRPMGEMKMGLMYFVTLVAAVCFVAIYALFVQPKSLPTGVSYGLIFGVGGVISMGFGTYSVMPLPLHLGMVWFLGFMAETVVGGVLLVSVIKEPKTGTENP